VFYVPAANLALSKFAWQGITLNKGAASRATDGFAAAAIEKRLCAMSGRPVGPPGLGGPWIAVDLGSSVRVAYVVLWLPKDRAPGGEVWCMEEA
jgi:hypothetical protein